MWRTLSVTLFACTLAGPGAAQAWGQWEQTHKLTAADGAAYNRFGFSVSISGDVGIVGTLGDDDAGASSGSAYLFDVTTGEQLHKLTADDAAAMDWFGRSVAISGNMAIAGARGDLHAPGSGGFPNGEGSAYLFDVATGLQHHKLTASDAAASDAFGYSVAVSGGIAIVGAPYDDDACPGYQFCQSGSAYLFDVTTGQQLHKLTADDAEERDHFGEFVAISGGVAIIGAGWSDDAGPLSGSAYLFEVSTGEQLHKLTADDAAAHDVFGGSVAISEDIAIVGAPFNDDAGGQSGSAYLFDVTTGQQLHKLTAEDAAAHDYFGYSVSISGSISVVGAYGDDDACAEDPDCVSGSAYLFDVTTEQQLCKLTAVDAAAGDEFGWSVSISGDMVIVGAPWDDDAGNRSGSAYVFEQGDLCGDEDGDGRVTICHLPPGNPENAHTITVGVDAVPAHLAHCDHCGPCGGDGGLLMSGTSAANDNPCSTDLDNSGDVGAADLAELLGAWGPNPGHPADLDGDGNVGPLDLAMVLGAWGPCP